MPHLYLRFSIIVVSALLLATSAAASSPRRVGTAGVTVVLPAGWHVTRPDQGSVTNPLTRVVVSSGQIEPDLISACQTQVASYAFPKTAVAIVVVEWTEPIGGLKIGSGLRRPRRFTPSRLPIRKPPVIECFDGAGGSAQFADHGRSFAAYVLLGRRAPWSLAARARSVLDTLRVATR